MSPDTTKPHKDTNTLSLGLIAVTLPSKVKAAKAVSIIPIL